MKSQNSSACSDFRKSPAPRVRSLGITRQQHFFLPEKSEKAFIKEDLWKQPNR